MPLTVEQAADQVKAAIEARGKFNVGNVLDSVIGVATNNSAELQAYLNELLKKKGVLSAADEKVLQDLLNQQEVEKKKRQQIRTKNTLLIIGAAVVLGGMIYFLVKKK